MTDHLKKAVSGSKKSEGPAASPNSLYPESSNLVAFPKAGKGSGAPGVSGNMANRKLPEMVSFDRRELDQLLNVYGFKVGDGEWRDYAIDMLKERAIFSVFQRQGDVPLYQIEKNPKLARKQGAYSITNAAGQVLKRGHELAVVLKYFDRKPKLHSV